MKIVRIEGSQTIHVTGIRCDRCNAEVRDDQGVTSEFARYEYLGVEFTAGYGAKAFDDGTHYTCDLCERCVKELLGPYLRSREPSWTYQPVLPSKHRGGQMIFNLLDWLDSP